MTNQGPSLQLDAPDTANPHLQLRPTETVVAQYRPKFALFLQKSISLAILTTIGFGFIPGLELSFMQRIGLAIFLVIVFMIVFEEWRGWLDRRSDQWTLTSQRLLLTNTREIEEVSWLNLQDIAQVRVWMWWALRLRGTDGRVTVMQFVGPVGHIRKELTAAITSNKGNTHG